jgi:tetratricopeptide (TPR) repeat protein
MGTRVSNDRSAEAPAALPKALVAAHARYTQALSHWHSGQTAESKAICDELLRDHPSYAAPLHLLGSIHLARGEHQSALTFLVRASAAQPERPGLAIDLAHALGFAGAPEVALDMLRNEMARNPTSAAAFLAAGRICESQFHYEVAEENYLKAAALDPGEYFAALRLGEMYTVMGERQSSAKQLWRAHELRPTAVSPLAGLATLPGDLVCKDLLVRIEAAMPAAKERGGTDELRLSFAKASALHKLGRHVECWTELVDVNKRAFERYGDGKVSERRFRRRHLKRAESLLFSVTTPLPARSDQPAPLFILGPSRSGKSSVESLTTHLPRLRRGYESPIVARALEEALQAEDLPPRSALSDLPREFDDRFSATFSRLLRQESKGAELFTITSAGNIYFVDRLASALPAARFVFVIRNKWDLAFEIFLKWYTKGNGYSYDWEETLEYVETYHRLAQIWADRIPDRTLTLFYPQCVTSPGETLAAIAGLAGVDRVLSEPSPADSTSGSATPYLPFFTERATAAAREPLS